MGAVELGFQPIDISVYLPADGAFVAKLVAEAGWPDGTEIELRFATEGAPIVWPATVSGTDAYWNVDQDDVLDVIAANTPKTVRLHYTDSVGGEDLLWGRGRVFVA